MQSTLIPPTLMAATASAAGGIFGMSALTKTAFLAYIVPPFACQYTMGILVQLEGTRIYRFALLPVALWLAWRATFVDMSGGDSTQVQKNAMLMAQMCSISTQIAAWAFAQIQYRRHSAVDDREKSNRKNIYTACWDCWDLLINPRGIGWNWPRGLVIPKRTYGTDSRVNFILQSAVRLSLNLLAFDVCRQTIRALGPGSFGSLQGGTLFDHSLSPVLELLRSVLVSALAASTAYFMLQCNHQFLVIVSVGLFRRKPSQWPPLFDSPWLSASLGDLWGRRWHQLLRGIVLSLGGQPFDYLFGRLGGLLGAFLVSGIFHDLEMRSLGRGGRSVAIVGFWLMNGVGVVLERVWKKFTGRSVGGVWGRMWMAGWLLLWGIPMVDAYAQVGRFALLELPFGFEPLRALVAFARLVCSRS